APRVWVALHAPGHRGLGAELDPAPLTELLKRLQPVFLNVLATPNTELLALLDGLVEALVSDGALGTDGLGLLDLGLAAFGEPQLRVMVQAETLELPGDVTPVDCETLIRFRVASRHASWVSSTVDCVL